MRVYGSAVRALRVLAAPLAILIGAGCAATINHAYDPATNFGLLKTYAWAPGPAISQPANLVDTNVRFIADPLLEQKGFSRGTGSPDFVVAIRFDSYPVTSYEGYELSTLSLNVYRADGQTLIWRGTASGSISTDAASGDLKNAVQGILAAFPPK